MTAVELAWAAGLFEGEGTVRINKPSNNRKNCGSLLASVVNTDRQVLEFFQARWPGYMKSATGLGPRQKPAWVWVIAATKAAAFLRDIRPFVVRDRVRQRIDHGLYFQGQKRRGRGRSSPEYIEDQWNAYWWMCHLNERGVKPGPEEAELVQQRKGVAGDYR